MGLVSERESVKTRDRERRKEFDAPLEHSECFAKRADLLEIRPREGGWIRLAPVRRHGLPRPHWAYFAGSVVADGENEIEQRRTCLSELIPVLTT